MTEDTTPTPDAQDELRPVIDEPQLFHFSLILAEVIFTCELGVQTRRTQFVSKVDQALFPRSRLVQLQKIAATNVVNEVKLESNGSIKKVQVEAVYLHGFFDCGWMTEAEFMANETALVAAPEIAAEDTAAPVEEPTPDGVGGDNVVQFRQP